MLSENSFTYEVRGGGRISTTILADVALETVEVYRKVNSSKSRLFTGLKMDTPVTTRTVQKILGDTPKRAGIEKKVSVHAHWHSFVGYTIVSVKKKE